jgi:Mn2+/Fe2+ NRAMP family transporter
MDFGKLRTGELIAGIAGVALLIVMFFSWYGAANADALSAAGFDTSANAWEIFSWVDLLLALAALVAIGAALLAASGRSVALPVAASVIITIMGVAVALLVLYRIVNQPGDNDLIEVKFGAYLGFLICLGVAAGGFLAMADEGTSGGDAAGRTQAGGAPAPPAPPAPPPEPAPPTPPAGGPPQQG